MKMRDIVRKHKRELQKAQRTGQLELSRKAEEDLMQWAMDNGEVNTDDEDDFIDWLDNNLDDILKGKIKESVNEVKVKYDGTHEKGRGPTGIAYAIPHGHPDAENPKTRKKYPERQTAAYKKAYKALLKKKAPKALLSHPVSEARLSRKEQIIADAERKLNFKIKELQYLKMKKEMEAEGLWANIHAKRKRGERMRKKGEKGAPTADAMAKAKAGSKNGSTSEALMLSPSQKPMMKRVKARFPRLKDDTKKEIVMLVKPGSTINSRRFVELGQAYDDGDMKKLDQLITKYTADDVKRRR